MYMYVWIVDDNCLSIDYWRIKDCIFHSIAGIAMLNYKRGSFTIQNPNNPIVLACWYRTESRPWPFLPRPLQSGDMPRPWGRNHLCQSWVAVKGPMGCQVYPRFELLNPGVPGELWILEEDGDCVSFVTQQTKLVPFVACTWSRWERSTNVPQESTRP